MERKQFKELLKDKEEEIELLSSQQGFEDQFQELNKLLNTEKLKNEELSKKQVKNNDDSALKKELEQKEVFVQQIQVQHQQAIEIMKQSNIRMHIKWGVKLLFKIKSAPKVGSRKPALTPTKN